MSVSIFCTTASAHASHCLKTHTTLHYTTQCDLNYMHFHLSHILCVGDRTSVLSHRPYYVCVCICSYVAAACRYMQPRVVAVAIDRYIISDTLMLRDGAAAIYVYRYLTISSVILLIRSRGLNVHQTTECMMHFHMRVCVCIQLDKWIVSGFTGWRTHARFVGHIT